MNDHPYTEFIACSILPPGVREKMLAAMKPLAEEVCHPDDKNAWRKLFKTIVSDPDQFNDEQFILVIKDIKHSISEFPNRMKDKIGSVAFTFFNEVEIK